MDWLKDAGALLALVGCWGVLIAWTQVVGVLGMVG